MTETETHVVTWAQNVTPVHNPTWTALQRYCAAHAAELHVIPGRYHNPTSHWSKAAEASDQWADELTPFLVREPRKLCRNLVVYGDTSITPTNAHPLSGFEGYADDHSAVFGHPRMQLTTVPRPAREPRIFATTGAITRPHYIPSGAGRKARKHHTFGAVVIEVEADGTYHLRQLSATKGGAIYDVAAEHGVPGLRYTPEGISTASAPALVLGDIHAEMHTSESKAEVLAAVASVGPRTIVAHDVSDFSVGGHHNRHKWWDGASRSRPIRDDLDKSCAFLEDLAQIAPVVVVDSNHHDHVDRWLQETHPKDTPHNAELWVRLWDLYYRGDRTCGFERYLRHEYTGARGLHPVRFMAHGEPLWINGVFCGYHGHRGTNGARGSLRGFARLGTRMVVGHTHAPGRLDGVDQVGVMAPVESFDFRQGAPDASLRSMCAIWLNGKTQLLHLIDGRFRPQ